MAARCYWFLACQSHAAARRLTSTARRRWAGLGEWGAWLDEVMWCCCCRLPSSRPTTVPFCRRDVGVVFFHCMMLYRRISCQVACICRWFVLVKRAQFTVCLSVCPSVCYYQMGQTDGHTAMHKAPSQCSEGRVMSLRILWRVSDIVRVLSSFVQLWVVLSWRACMSWREWLVCQFKLDVVTVSFFINFIIVWLLL